MPVDSCETGIARLRAVSPTTPIPLETKNVSPMLTGVRKNYSYIYNIYKNLFLDARFKYYT